MSTGLVFGIPTLNRPTSPEWGLAIKALNPPINFNSIMATVPGMAVADARNHIVREALRLNAKYIFFVGDDTIPPAHTLRQLIFRIENDPKIGVVGGVYFTKSDPPAPLIFKENGAGSYWDWKVGEFFEVTGLGMDCTLIRTEVFKNLPEPWFKTVDEDSFLSGVNHAEMWTEDLYFLDKLKKFTDWKIMVDTGIIAGHYDWQTGRTYTIPPNSLPMRRMEFSGEKRIIDIGCGPQYRPFEEGIAVRYDIDERWNPDYRGDVRQLPFGDESFDIVFSSHVLEHLGRNETIPVLKEWTRILKRDGELRLVVPNIMWAAKMLTENRVFADRAKIENDIMNVLYGGQTSEYDFHKTGFTEQKIKHLLGQIDFHVTKYEEQGYNIILTAVHYLSIKAKVDKTKKKLEVSPRGQLAKAVKPVLKATKKLPGLPPTKRTSSGKKRK